MITVTRKEGAESVNSEFTIAVHSLVFLAYLPDQMASSEQIANNVSTHPARIRKIMSCLRKNGFVKTKEGIGGGYILNRDPQEITLAQIYRSVSCGTLKPSWCTGNPEQDCVVSANIQGIMDQIFCDAETYYEAYLNKITISSVLGKIRECK